MRAQAGKHQRTGDKYDSRNSPEITGVEGALPKPHVMNECVPIPFDDIEDRVELDQGMISLRNHFNGPENRSHPETEL